MTVPPPCFTLGVVMCSVSFALWHPCIIFRLLKKHLLLWILSHKMQTQYGGVRECVRMCTWDGRQIFFSNMEAKDKTVYMSTFWNSQLMFRDDFALTTNLVRGIFFSLWWPCESHLNPASKPHVQMGGKKEKKDRFVGKISKNTLDLSGRRDLTYSVSELHWMLLASCVQCVQKRRL